MSVCISKETTCVEELTYASIMVPDIQEVATACAVIATPSVLTAAFRALTSFLVFALVNVCAEDASNNNNKKTYEIKKLTEQLGLIGLSQIGAVCQIKNY